MLWNPVRMHLSVSNRPSLGELYGQLRILCILTLPIYSLYLFVPLDSLGIIDYKGLHLDISVTMLETMS